MLDPTATHLPVLESYIKSRNVKTVLEFGCGLYSTKLFHDLGCKVTSIEMQHKEWLDRVKEQLPDADIRLSIGQDEWRKLKLADRYDLVFVDGHADSRPECMMWAKNHTNLIIAHDTEHPYYCWQRADMRGFSEKLYDDMKPTTTVWERA